jgi:hypothetical protein
MLRQLIRLCKCGALRAPMKLVQHIQRIQAATGASVSLRLCGESFSLVSWRFDSIRFDVRNACFVAAARFHMLWTEFETDA